MVFDILIYKILFHIGKTFILNNDTFLTNKILFSIYLFQYTNIVHIKQLQNQMKQSQVLKHL